MMLHILLNSSISFYMNLKYKLSCSTSTLLFLSQQQGLQVYSTKPLKPVLQFLSQKLPTAALTKIKSTGHLPALNFRKVDLTPASVNIYVGQLRPFGAGRHFSQITRSLTLTPRRTSFPIPVFRNLSTSSGNSRSVIASQKIRVDMDSALKQQQKDLLKDPRLLTKEEGIDFNKMFHQIVSDLTENPELRDMAETNRWLARVMQFNVPHGKKNRGLTCVVAYKFMAEELNEENLQLSYVLGWCVEMLQAFFLVSDDIMDHSETRRGQPCWYKVDNLGPAAFNDALLIETSIYVLLAKYFSNKEYYADLLEIFHDATNKTIFGQSLDTRTGLMRRMETYSIELYTSIVKYKTSFYSFTLPVFLAMAMSGIKDPELRRQVRTVTLEMGHYFQIQDDYLDCFGDEEVTGKIGTDIQDCKCSWLFVQALQEATPAQREVLLANYGQNEPAKVDAIKKLYNDMKLEQKYKDFEESSYNTISEHIMQMSPGLPKSLFVDMINKIYKRKS